MLRCTVCHRSCAFYSSQDNTDMCFEILNFQHLFQQNLEEKHALRIQLEGQVEELWKQFQAVSSFVI